MNSANIWVDRRDPQQLITVQTLPRQYSLFSFFQHIRCPKHHFSIATCFFFALYALWHWKSCIFFLSVHLDQLNSIVIALMSIIWGNASTFHTSVSGDKFSDVKLFFRLQALTSSCNFELKKILNRAAISNYIKVKDVRGKR